MSSTVGQQLPPFLVNWLNNYSIVATTADSLPRALLSVANPKLRSEITDEVIQRYSVRFTNPNELQEVFNRAPAYFVCGTRRYRTRPIHLYVVCDGTLTYNYYPTTEDNDDCGVLYYHQQTGWTLPLHPCWIDAVRTAMRQRLTSLRPCYINNSEGMYITQDVARLVELGVTVRPLVHSSQFHRLTVPETHVLHGKGVRYWWQDWTVHHANLHAYPAYRQTLEQFGVVERKFKGFDLGRQKVDQEHIIAWDIEAFTDAVRQFVPYCLCTSDGDVYWGTDCLARFVDRLLTIALSDGPELYYLAHNGSGFDHLFLLREFLTRDVVPNWVVIIGDRVYGLDYGRLRFRDTCRLYPSRLAEFCRQMGGETQKGQFDHEKVNEHNYNQFREESSKYCLQDCVCLKQAWCLYRDRVWSLAQFELTGQYSLTAACFNILMSRFLSGCNIRAPLVSEIDHFRSSYRREPVHLFRPGVYHGPLTLYTISLYPILVEPVPVEVRRHHVDEVPTQLDDYALYRLTNNQTDGQQWYWGVELRSLNVFDRHSCTEWYEFIAEPLFQSYATSLQSLDLLLNHLHHKFGYYYETSTKLVNTADLETVKTLIRDHRVDNMTPLVSHYALAMVDHYPVVDPGHFVHLASFIEAKQRAMVRQTLNSDVVYCTGDTMLTSGDSSLTNLWRPVESVQEAIVVGPHAYGYLSTDGTPHVRLGSVPRAYCEDRYDLLRQLADGHRVDVHWDEFQKANWTGVRLVARSEVIEPTVSSGSSS